MSDERPVFARWRYPFAGMLGNKLLIIEFFEARHWRLRQGMATYPAPRDDWSKRYRLRLNGKWFGQRRLSFYTMVEAAQIVERLLERNNFLTMENK